MTRQEIIDSIVNVVWESGRIGGCSPEQFKQRWAVTQTSCGLMISVAAKKRSRQLYIGAINLVARPFEVEPMPIESLSDSDLAAILERLT